MLTAAPPPVPGARRPADAARGFGALDGLRLAYVGDGNNIARSLALARRPGRRRGARGGAGRLRSSSRRPAPSSTDDPAEAVAGADAVYTDVWVSHGRRGRRPRRAARALAPYRIDDALLDRGGARRDRAALPARAPGEEITAEVLYGERQRIWDQAENRRHAQKALLEWLVQSS